MEDNNAPAVVSEPHTMTASDFLTTCDPDMLMTFIRDRLDFKSRTSLLVCNKQVRHHLIRHCRHAVDSHITYESYVRKRLRAMQAIEAPNLHTSVHGPHRHQFPLVPSPLYEIRPMEIMELLNSNMIPGVTRDILTEKPLYEFGVTTIGQRWSDYVLEATLRPTTDVLIPEMADPTIQTVIERNNDVPDGSQRLEHLLTQTFFTLRPNAKGVHQSRGLGIVQKQGYRPMEFDTRAAASVSEMLETLMFDANTVNDPNASILVMLTTPLSHVLQRQDRSWICYMGRMRSSLAQEGPDTDHLALEQRLQVDDALAIRGLFMLTGALTMRHIESGRKKTALLVHYMGMPMEKVVHRIE